MDAADTEVSPFYNTFPTLRLGHFEPADAHDFVVLARPAVPPFSEAERTAILEFANGHPLALQAACYWMLDAKLRGTGSVHSAIRARSGIIQLLWKSTVLPEFATHGREIVDAGTGDRLGWAFAVRKGDFLDVEELFVWPDFRGRGYGRALADMLLELAAQMGTRLRMWVPFADCEPENRDALMAAAGMLGLELHPSPERWAGYVALDQARPGPLPTLRMPPRPASTREDLAAWHYEVWYGTNRAPLDASDLSKGFGIDRSENIHYGKCEVVIPKSHNFGSIGSNWWKRWMQGTDDRLRLVATRQIAEPDFWADICREIQAQDGAERHSMVFLHGYNVSFEQAAIRAAQIGFDLKISGVMGFFTWPSKGSLLGYPVDEATIEASESAITRFLIDFVSAAGDDPIHLLAHSMGNRGLLRSLQRIMGDVQQQAPTRFGQIFILAPDIDADLFKSLANVFLMFAERTTLYASPADRALEMSRWLHTFPRAGFTPPVTVVGGIDTIHVPQFNLLDLGHSYYAEAGPVLHDVFDLTRRNAAPRERQRLVQATTDTGQIYWQMIR